MKSIGYNFHKFIYIYYSVPAISQLSAPSGHKDTNTRKVKLMNFSRKDLMFMASRRLTIKALLPEKYPCFQLTELLSIIPLPRWYTPQNIRSSQPERFI
ncbi:MAG: hypothetical protein H5T43_01965 [Methanomethylovorans sp.]|jgi:hypothetical protein|nr:hypothetical protein [Methanomethylovorans sp.]